MEATLSLRDGFRFVYGPWATLQTGRIAFLSLNPGRAPSSSALRDVSDERGNSYSVERHTTRSPITDQALRAFSFFGAQPDEVLTGVVCPFRTPSWKDLTKEKRDHALELGRQFWVQPLQRPGLELIVCCSTEASQAVVGWLHARHEASASAGWGNIAIHRYRTKMGVPIIALPHLSRFRLFGRPQSETAIRGLLE
ncbi:MAG: hypothetical protein U0934_04150 [Pseudotabrizicola sp.]|nr:hypothetical protein [Pseudotabrizicola sp.]MDZ7573131.1 hypothetical protein [Pseudotabrizicola sp.]